MNDSISKLPYRKNVSCIVFKDNEFLLVQNKGWQKHWWKFPQGGIENGEEIMAAATRELLEELSTDNFNFIGVSQHTNKYDWNDESVSLAGFRWRGQDQSFVIAEFLGEKGDIRINSAETQDFIWVTKDELWDRINQQDKNFTNYKESIEKVLEEFNMI